MKPHVSFAAALLALTLAATAAPARAATLDLAADVLTYLSPSGEGPIANDLTIARTGTTYTIDDPAETVIVLGATAAAAGCTNLNANTARCPASAFASFLIQTGLGGDLIDLAGSTKPATVQPGDGNDHVLGGEGADTFVWTPGDDNDTVDGGPGDDTLDFSGSNIGETYVIAPEAGGGFTLLRNIGAVQMTVAGTETLRLTTRLGADTVFTYALPATTQLFEDGDDDAADVLTVDAAGGCPFGTAGTIEIDGFQPIHHTGFQSYSFNNVVCGAIVELAGGTFTYYASIGATNDLAVSLAGATYTITDAGEAAISPTPATVDAGCTRVNASTLACPQAAIARFTINAGQGNDRVVLTGADAPATVSGESGADTIVGGDGDDVFVWSPGGGDDTIDGGPGDDVLTFNGSNASEIFTIVANGTGFDLLRNVADIGLAADRVEVLELFTYGGGDFVGTMPLRATTQRVTTGSDATPDTLSVNGTNLCLTQLSDRIEIEGRPPILFASFAEVIVGDVFCIPDPCVDAGATLGCTVNGVRNQACRGTDGNDVIVGTKESDVILGGGGKDRIRAGNGDDLVCGEAGDDTLVGGKGNDTLIAGPGNDKLQGDVGNDKLIAGPGDDQLNGGTGTDTLDGGTGLDRLKGGADADTLDGGAGLDLVDGGRGPDSCADVDQPGPFKRCELPPEM